MGQEKLIKAGPTPYTIVRATQFFEFLGGIAQAATNGKKVNPSTAFMQPIAADDVAVSPEATCVEIPVDGIVEIAGPERVRQN